MRSSLLINTSVVCLLIAGLLVAAPLHAQNGPGERQMEAVSALEQVLISGSGIDSFIAGWLDPVYRTAMPEDSLRSHMHNMHEAVAAAQALDLALEGDEIHLIFSEGAEATVKVAFASGDAGLINKIELEGEQPAEEMTADAHFRQMRRTRVRAVEALGSSVSNDQFDQFMAENMTPALRNKKSQADWHVELRALQKTIAAADVVRLSESDGVLVLAFRGPANADVSLALDEQPPHLLTMMEIDHVVDVSGEEQPAVEIAPISWENMESRLAEEAALGAAGAVLVAQNGKVMLRKGFGQADREAKRANTATTMFGLGSIPIDFTRAAILKLADDGMLALTDALPAFFQAVPADKATITLEHLLTGQSGLPNFHHRADLDEDFDLTWIDREEAVGRMFAQPLLFEPGTARSHSHSAFVLLAAIVEQVSGQDYGTYLKSTFFTPMGMSHTGLYGKGNEFEEVDMAVGYGASRVGEKNMPLYWGPTSWLIMGSGGMVSTLDDMYTWIKAIYAGEYLSPQAMAYYGESLIGGGISDRGFLVLLYHDGDKTLIYMSNAHEEEGDRSMALGDAFMDLVRGEAGN